MSDYIKREDAIRHIVKTSAQNELDIPAIGTVIYILSEMDSADVRENVRGEWIRTSKNLYACSNCGNCIIGERTSGMFFCPHCGADMRGES